ncbi:MAG TPA: hypothetical protein VF595_12350 [Tepidisphaeraceae bacterium]|jgi:hypothetical protein
MKQLKAYKRAVTRPVQQATDVTLGRTMGWVSLAIGLTEIAAAQPLQRLMGLKDKPQHLGILRVLGAREILHGVDLLSHRDPTPGLWSRVAGDALDGVMLGVAATKTKRPAGLAAVAAMVLPVVVADVVLALRLTKQPPPAKARRWFW